MPSRRSEGDQSLQQLARELLARHWAEVEAAAEATPGLEYLDAGPLRTAIESSVNHAQVGYRFCLLVQLCGKLANPSLDALALQRGKAADRHANWDARTLARQVVAPFNLAQGAVIGSAADPYVGNAMRIPRMRRDDSSKKDIVGWNVLIDVLEEVQGRDTPDFAEAVFRQTLLAFWRRQRTLDFSDAVPSRASLDTVLSLCERFLAERSGGDWALVIAGALFDAIGHRFRLYVQVNRARINATDEASGQAADLECVGADGRVVLAVEVKDRALTLADMEGTIAKARRRDISEVFFAVPAVARVDEDAVERRVVGAYSVGQSLYRMDMLGLARSVLALAGESGRTYFLHRIGEHLNTWNTQPSPRRARKALLEAL